MTQPRNHRLILTGPHAGKTIRLRGHQFTEGVLEFYGAAEDVEGLVTYLGRSYQAFLDGSDELRAAQERDRKNKEVVSGECGIQGELSESGSLDNQSDSDLQPEGEGATETPADGWLGAIENEEGSEGDVSGGDGYPDTGVPDAEARPSGYSEAARSEVDVALQNAVYALDPDNDDHWTAAGKPAMASVETAYGSAGITRRDVEAAAPGWDRDKARESKDLAELTQ